MYFNFETRRASHIPRNHVRFKVWSLFVGISMFLALVGSLLCLLWLNFVQSGINNVTIVEIFVCFFVLILGIYGFSVFLWLYILLEDATTITNQFCAMFDNFFEQGK